MPVPVRLKVFPFATFARRARRDMPHSSTHPVSSIPEKRFSTRASQNMHNQGIIIDGIARNEDIDDDALALACRERLVVRPHHPSRERSLHSHNSCPPRPRFVHAGMDTRTACTYHDISAWPRERPSTRMMRHIPSSQPASSAKTLLLQSSDSSTSTTTMDYDENMHDKHVTFTNDVAFPSNLEDVMCVLSPTLDNDESDEDVSESPFHLRMAEMCFIRDPQWRNDALKYKSRRKLWGDTLPSGKMVNNSLLAIERWQSTSRCDSKSRNSDENRPSMGDE